MDDSSDISSVHQKQHNKTTFLSPSAFQNSDKKAKTMVSTGSMASQSSTGSSTLSTIQNLSEINKVMASKQSNPRKELLTNRDNKVYSYKINQLISIIKSSQDNASKKATKKKPVTNAKIPTTTQGK